MNRYRIRVLSNPRARCRVRLNQRRLAYRALALNCDAPLNDKDGAESRNWREGKPVRVVRSSKGRRISKYAPEEGNRYDGIYKVQ